MGIRHGWCVVGVEGVDAQNVGTVECQCGVVVDAGSLQVMLEGAVLSHLYRVYDAGVVPGQQRFPRNRHMFVLGTNNATLEIRREQCECSIGGAGELIGMLGSLQTLWYQ